MLITHHKHMTTQKREITEYVSRREPGNGREELDDDVG
jgi:hypothetical protein